MSSGEGLKRADGVLPPSARDLLDKVKDEVITSIKVVRTPLSSAVRTALNWLSMGTYEKAVKDASYDSMMHLAMFINGKYQLDKQAVIVFARKNPVKRESETMDISVHEGLTIGALIDNTRKGMGNKRFTGYDARKNNCQDFLLSILKHNNMGTDESQKFIKQDADAVLNKVPKISEKLIKTATEVGAVLDKVIEGEGAKQKKPNAWMEHYKSTCASNKGKPVKELVRLAKESYKKA